MKAMSLDSNSLLEPRIIRPSLPGADGICIIAGEARGLGKVKIGDRGIEIEAELSDSVHVMSQGRHG